MKRYATTLTFIAAVAAIPAAPCIALAEPAASPAFVIPPEAEGRIRGLVDATPEAMLDDRLVLQSAKIEGHEVVLRYGTSLDADTTLAVTLRHPSLKEGAIRPLDAFSVHGVPGPVNVGGLVALVERLRAVKPDGLWKEVAPPVGGAKPAVSSSGQPDAGVDVARRRLADALHAMEIGDLDEAGASLLAIGQDEVQRRALGLDLARAWHRLGRAADAKAAVAAWRADGPPSALDAVRALALSGEETEVTKLTAALTAAPDLACGGAEVARDLASAGQGPVADALLAALDGPKACIEIGRARSERAIDGKHIAEADTLTAALLARFPDDEYTVGQRAQVMMALDRPEDAATLLEKAAWKDPESGLISALLGAYNRVQSEEWQQAKLNELVARAERDGSDHIAAFLAGVLLHYDGQWAASTKALEPLSDVFGEQPRLHIYLGMNAFNLGDRDKAMAHIQTAHGLEAPDPDVYYCRAEIQRWSDPAAALADLNRYLAQTEGSPTSSAGKRHRVETMATMLEACIASKAPVPCVGPWEHPRGHEANAWPEPPPDEGGPSWRYYAGAVGLLLLLFGGFMTLRRRRQTA